MSPCHRLPSTPQKINEISSSELRSHNTASDLWICIHEGMSPRHLYHGLETSLCFHRLPPPPWFTDISLFVWLTLFGQLAWLPSCSFPPYIYLFPLIWKFPALLSQSNVYHAMTLNSFTFVYLKNRGPTLRRNWEIRLWYHVRIQFSPKGTLLESDHNFNKKHSISLHTADMGLSPNGTCKHSAIQFFSRGIK